MKTTRLLVVRQWILDGPKNGKPCSWRSRRWLVSLNLIGSVATVDLHVSGILTRTRMTLRSARSCFTFCRSYVPGYSPAVCHNAEVCFVSLILQWRTSHGIYKALACSA